MAVSNTFDDRSWLDLCTRIALERDPDEFTKLANELNRVLEGRERELRMKGATSSQE